MKVLTPAFKIFVAEDDEDDLYLLQQAFNWRAPDCELVCVTNGEQLLRELNIDPQLPQLILLDLNMPLMDGFQTLRHLRKDAYYNRVPVVILSTCNEKATADNCLALGADAYRVKPTLFNELADLVHHIRHQWLTRAVS